MPLKKQVTISEMKVGILVTIALILMAVLILQQSWGVAWFAETEKALTYLTDVGGLKPGAPVWLAGIEIGRVRQVSIVAPEGYEGNRDVFARIARVKEQMESIDPGSPRAAEMQGNLQESLRNLKDEIRFVEVQLEIRSQYIDRIDRDSEVAIESRGLIGDSFIQISPGTSGVAPARKGDYYLIEGVRTAGFREIMTGANDVIANFGILSDQVKNIAFKINPDRVGQGLADTINEMQTALKQANGTFVESTKLMQDLRQGEGTMGKLVSDPALYARLTESVEKLNALIDEIQKGSGTMAKLIHDPTLYDDLSATVAKAKTMLDRIEKGEGTLGRLSKDDALYVSSRQAIDRFASLVEKIDQGEGSMGKLVRDPSLYNNLNQSTAEITKLIYDLRRDPKKYLTIRFRLF